MEKWKKYKSYGKNRSQRLRYFDYSHPYYTYFVTMDTRKRNPYFIKTSTAKMVFENIKYYSYASKYDLIAACVMPDHIHFLIQARENAKDLRNLVRDFKKYTTKKSWELGIKGKLWQRGYYEHIVRKNESIFVISEYILNNPTKAGLIENRGNYPFLFPIAHPT